jgi:hypothetical protein
MMALVAMDGDRSSFFKRFAGQSTRKPRIE